jgi:hypothetical protein
LLEVVFLIPSSNALAIVVLGAVTGNTPEGFSRGNNSYDNKNSSSSGNNIYSNDNSSNNIHDSNNPMPRGRAGKPQPEEVRRSFVDSAGSTDSASDADPPRKTRDGR